MALQKAGMLATLLFLANKIFLTDNAEAVVTNAT